MKTLLDLVRSSVPDARILSVAGDDRRSLRLRELGFCRGASVRWIRKAPLGDPLVFAIKGSEVAIRRRDARLIEVEPLRIEPGPGAQG